MRLEGTGWRVEGVGVRVGRGWWVKKLYLSIHVNEHLAYCCLQKEGTGCVFFLLKGDGLKV